MIDPSHVSLGLIGGAVAVLCCLVPLLLVSSGGVVLAALASYLGYVWIALPILVAGLAAYLLLRRAKLRNNRAERSH